jgi:hypothetical protein
MSRRKDIAAPSPPVRVRDLKGAKRLLSRLIWDLQRGAIKGQQAKDLCYLLSTFIMLVRDFELEQKLIRLEKRIDETQGETESHETYVRGGSLSYRAGEDSNTPGQDSESGEDPEVRCNNAE